MLTRIDGELEGRPAVGGEAAGGGPSSTLAYSPVGVLAYRWGARRQARGRGGGRGSRAFQHVGVLARQRSEIGRVTIVGREGKCRPLCCEGDAAHEELRAVCKRRAGLGEARQRICRPCNCCGRLYGSCGGGAA